jgi:hypothetical protein
MEKKINVNEFIFGRTKAEKKLQVLDAMSDNDIRKTSDATILRIYKECRGKDSDGKPNDRFWINCDRRAGNNWNSAIEFIYEHKGKAMVCLYVQNSSTDTSTCDSYANFNYGSRYNGSCRLGSFTYDADEIADVIRCILKEFVYYKYIERAERERKERIAKVLHWKIYNPVCNQFYDEWRCKYEGYGFNCSTPRTDRYHRAEKAVKEYVEQHIDELDGKTTEELQAIYRKIFRDTD